MRIPFATAVVLAACLSAPARAQVSRAAGPADTDVIAENVYERLFEGITLSGPQRTRALDAIRTSVAQEHAALAGQRPSRESWQRLVDLRARRDSTLRTLLPTPAHRAAFDERAAAMLPPRP